MTTKIRKGFRKIHLDDEIWQYKIGQSIVIFSPSNLRHLADQSKVSGLDWNSLERDYDKRTFDGITPKMIKEYIIKNLKAKANETKW